jgi:hypothetical protein
MLEYVRTSGVGFWISSCGVTDVACCNQSMKLVVQSCAYMYVEVRYPLEVEVNRKVGMISAIHEEQILVAAQSCTHGIAVSEYPAQLSC